MQHVDKWYRHRMEYNYCYVELSTSSLDEHLQTQYGVYWSQVINQGLSKEFCNPLVYGANQVVDERYFCPVLGCPGNTTHPCNM